MVLLIFSKMIYYFDGVSGPTALSVGGGGGSPGSIPFRTNLGK